ncbi:hypothetical protein [Streptomyces sp. NPDC001515]
MIALLIWPHKTVHDRRWQERLFAQQDLHEDGMASAPEMSAGSLRSVEKSFHSFSRFRSAHPHSMV